MSKAPLVKFFTKSLPLIVDLDLLLGPKRPPLLYPSLA
jgi:hypothetical protein